jgi:M6 family metalloprotease-like protein
LRQPDGEILHVRIWGDEHHTLVESLDGYALTRDPQTGVICYATLPAAHAGFASSGVRAGAPIPSGIVPHLREPVQIVRARTGASRARLAVEASPGALRALGTPTHGAAQGLCLLVDFPDDPATIPAANIASFLNQTGYAGYGNNGSVYDYYFDVSDGAFSFHNTVPVAYHRASKPKPYYVDPAIPFGLRARELIIEALTALNMANFNFATLDANDDGLVDGLSCFYAGWRDSAWGEGLWPHSWTINFAADGVRTTRYQISDLRDGPRLSTFCHESGHMLFNWPDLYDTGFESYGVGAFCLMTGHVAYTSGGNPQEPCAYLKDLVGWSQTEIIGQSAMNLAAAAGLNQIYKFPHPTHSTEYYLVENRAQSGRDAGLPASGLAVWHIDTLGDNSNEQQTPTLHYEATLVQADGRWDLEHNANTGDATDLWAAPLATSLSQFTSPSLRWWDGSAPDFALYAISSAQPVMTFSVVVGDDCNSNGAPDTSEIAADPTLDCNTDGVLDECEGLGADCNSNGRIDSCDVLAGLSDDCNANLLPDECEFATHDCDSDGVLDDCEIAGGSATDCDSNGRPDACDLASGAADCNDNGAPDACDLADASSSDCDLSGIPDECELAAHDCDSNGVHDACDLLAHPSFDCNHNGWLDLCDLASGSSADCDANNVPDECQALGIDCNSNGRLDACDVSGGFSLDCNTDGSPDECDLAAGTSLDCNHNNRPDECDLAAGLSVDCDANGKLDVCELAGRDCNFNQVIDACDIALGTSVDCNTNAWPDECDYIFGDSTDCDNNTTLDECEIIGRDCNANHLLDSCEIALHISQDCNSNGLPDQCDIAAGTSTDCNGNGKPDECELAQHDCNHNGRLDACDVAAGASRDCDHNGAPDECELNGRDCNQNSVPDVCDISGGTSPDCNSNLKPDECDVALGFSDDCDTSGVPDECELATRDCNTNGVLDACDLATGVSRDCNRNTSPDECEIAAGSASDCNHNAIPDACELTGADCDHNGILDSCDLAAGSSADCNHNNRPDACDIASGLSDDCDADNKPDECELAGRDCNHNLALDDCEIATGARPDCNDTGVPDECELVGADCNANGSPDECDLAYAVSTDCNTNSKPDECDLASGVGHDCDASGVLDECELTGRDCNRNSILDTCEIADGSAPDCNSNNRPDSCDITLGASADCNHNARPDECELAGKDCNANQVLDGCEIAAGSSSDCNANGSPDECELAGKDCNGNAILDSCELAAGSSADCNGNGKLDACDITAHLSNDCDSNSIPDECQIASHDCNANGLLDACDITAGRSADCQHNAVPDECELAGHDCNGNSILDACELPTHDCNSNGTVDSCDLASGASADCNHNNAPDDCDISPGGASRDDNRNGLPDECENSPCAVLQTSTMASPPGPSSFFGSAVSLSGKLLVGAYGDTTWGTQAGAVHIFSPSGAGWTLNATLRPVGLAPNDRFGRSVALTGANALIGAAGDDSRAADCGAAYQYRFENGSWTLKGKITSSDGVAFDEFGTSVAADGVWGAVAATGDDDRGSQSGSVYMFRIDGPSPTQQSKLTPSDGAPSDFFGSAVAVSGTMLAVGAYSDDDRGPNSGSVYVYRYGASWTQSAKLHAPDGAATDFFGFGAGASGDVLLVGAPGEDDLGQDAGAAYVFRYNGAQWSAGTRLPSPEGRAGDRFGASVAIKGDWAAVGAPGRDEPTFNSGLAYIYHYDGATWSLVGKWPTNAPGSAQFGQAVAVDATSIAIGNLVAPGDVFTLRGLDGDCNGNLKLDVCDISQAASRDCNLDSKPDECQIIAPGDSNGDGVSDRNDLGGLIACMGGPGQPPGAAGGACAPTCRAAFDQNADQSVDLRDFAALQRAWGQ